MMTVYVPPDGGPAQACGDDWPARLRRQVAAAVERRARRADTRAQLAGRRQAGLRARHAAKLARTVNVTQSSDLPTGGAA